jgi:hypothetical protein
MFLLLIHSRKTVKPTFEMFYLIPDAAGCACVQVLCFPKFQLLRPRQLCLRCWKPRQVRRFLHILFDGLEQLRRVWCSVSQRAISFNVHPYKVI